MRLFILAALICLRPSLSHAFSYASDVPQQQQWIMESDLKYLERVPGTLSSPFLAKIMKHNEFGAGHMQAWLEGRVKVVTASSFRLNIRIVEEGGQITSIERTNAEIADENRTRVLMTNFGGPVYAAGKRRSIFYAVDIPGLGPVKIDSPRQGLVRVGDELFQPLFANSNRIDDSVHAIFRLHTYFHEARHSDGNGETLTMPHVQCPEGHPYAGRYACDVAVNGAYRVGSEVVGALAEKCADCTQAEKDLLGIFKLDETSRILELKLSKKESEMCAMIRAWGKTASFCNGGADSEGLEWDDRGEIAK